MRIAGWATPSANEFEPRDVAKLIKRREKLRRKHKNGNGFGLTLGQQVHLVVDVPPSMFGEDHDQEEG